MSVKPLKITGSSKTTTATERFARSWVERNGCHEWQGALNPRGYGQFRADGKLHYAHRWAFYRAYGWWPQVAAHRCDNPRCVNPEHLFGTSIAGNNRDRADKDRGTRKLTPSQVVEVIEKYENGQSIRSLGAEYGVSRSSIQYRLRGRR